MLKAKANMRRGRVSIDELLVRETGLAPTDTRADAPYDLGDEEAEVWRITVNAMPTDHFIPANYPVLAQYCKHVIEARFSHKKLREFRKLHAKGALLVLDCKVYTELTKVQDAQSLAIARLARAMRLTQQANFNQSRRLPKPSDSTDYIPPQEEVSW